MHRYDFTVLNGDDTIAAAYSIALPNSRAAWPQVTELADKFDGPGCRIRITNEVGEVVILVSVAADRHPISAEAAA